MAAMQPNVSQCLVKRTPGAHAAAFAFLRAAPAFDQRRGCGQNRADAPRNYQGGPAFLHLAGHGPDLAIFFQDERFDRAAAATELRAKISKRVYKARRRKVHLRQPSCLNSSAFRTDVRSSKKQQPDDKTTRR
jgi:hypothetical protein